MRRLRPLLRALLLVAILLGAWALLGPWLKNTVYAIRLVSMPAAESIPVPVRGVAPRDLRDTWGGARGGGRKHEGIDIFARRGTAITSSTEGIVLRIGSNRLGGQVVWVLGPGGQRHYYAHLDSYAAIEQGQRVRPGTILGYVGTTGNAAGTPPHLHYGIYETDGAINPYPLLRQRPAGKADPPPAQAASATSARGAR